MKITKVIFYLKIQFRKFLLLGIVLIIFSNSCQAFNKKKDNNIKLSSSRIGNQLNPSILWSTVIGNGTGNFFSNLYPEHLGNVVYAADRKGIVKAININDGKEIWSIDLAEKKKWFFHIPALLSGGISAFGNCIYIGSERAQMYAINVKDGSVIWKIHTAGEVLSHPVIGKDGIIVHTSNGKLQMFNKNGTIKWTINFHIPEFSLRGESSPIIVSDLVVVGNDNGFISVISIKQGRIIWQRRVSQAIGLSIIDQLSDIDTTPVAIKNKVYVRSYDRLTALDLQSGCIIWQRNFGSTNDFIINNNCIYLFDRNDRLIVLNAKNGEILWTRDDLLHHVLTAPTLYNNRLVVGDIKGNIYWIDLENGCLLAKKKVNQFGFLNKLVVIEKKLLIQTKYGNLYAIIS